MTENNDTAEDIAAEDLGELELAEVTAAVEPASEPAPATEPALEAAPETAQELEPEPEPKPRRRIRSTTLFTAAVVIGVLGGVGTGYEIQNARPGTPLPPLAGSQPVYAPVGVYQGVAPAMLPASQDDATLTDGDLTKLLLPVPSGATTDPTLWQDQMVDPEQVSELCDSDEQESCLTFEYTNGVSAIADTNWSQGGFHVEVRLSRVGPGDSGKARNWNEDGSEPNPIPMPSGIAGYGYEFLDQYNANDDYAAAVHGDLVAEFWVSSPTAMPNPSLIDGLITQQMGRL